MKKTFVLSSGALLSLSCLLVVWSSSTSAHLQTTTLPGARAVIEAIRFSSLQAALDALPEEGGVVHMPPGIFEINEPLLLRRGDVLLQGSGTATHIKNLNTQGKPALVLEHPEGSDKRQNELWRIRLADFRITGNPKSGHGIDARRINEIFIDGVTVSEHGGDGIQLYYCYEDPRVCDSLITYNKKTGLHLIGCHDIVVSANQFEENHDAVRCIDGYNLTMSGNNLDDHLGHGVVIENTYGSVVAANMIEECHGTAIVLDRNCYGNTLSSNVIAHNGAGIDLRDAHGCAVSANTFTIMLSDALRIGPQSGRITVTGNNFSNSYVGSERVIRGADDLNAGGVVFSGTSNITVSGNLFSSLRPKGFALHAKESQNILFSGNVLTDVASDHEKLKSSTVGGNHTSQQ